MAGKSKKTASGATSSPSQGTGSRGVGCCSIVGPILAVLFAVGLITAPFASWEVLAAVTTAGIHAYGAAHHATLGALWLTVGVPYEMMAAPEALTFDNQVVVITGASSGIGADMARQLAEYANVTLVLAARRQEKLVAVAEDCKSINQQTKVDTVSYDAADPAAGSALVEGVLKRFGRIDTLILNAGIAGPWAEFETLPQDLRSLHRVMDVNYWGYVYAAHAAIPALKASRGRLAAVSSFYGRIPAPYQAGYSATKHAMQGFFNTLRPELARHDVSVTLHLPGGIATEVQQKFETADSKRVNLLMPDAFLAPSPKCAASVLSATLWRQAEAYYPFYALAASEFRQAAKDLFDRGFSELVKYYMDQGFFQLQ